jgi:hypothetical protein
VHDRTWYVGVTALLSRERKGHMSSIGRLLSYWGKDFNALSFDTAATFIAFHAKNMDTLPKP